MPISVVRNVGDLKRAKNVDGQEVFRQDFIEFQGHLVPCLNTDTHFMYRSKRLGATHLCTCGGYAVTVGYHEYRKYSSFIGSEVLACFYLINEGKHADGSS